MSKGLTSKAVDAAKPAGARREIPDGLVPGLYLIVQPTGAKSWAVRYRHAGQPRKLTLGPLAPDLGGPEPPPRLGAPLGLGGARKLARDQLLIVAAGRDPGAEKQAAKRAARDTSVADRDLMRTVAAQFLDRYLKPRAKPGYYAAVARIFDKDVLPRWGDRRIHDVARRDVLDLLDAVVERGAAVQANRVLAAVRKLFNWAVSRDILAASPAQGAKTPTPERSRERTLSDAELRWLWRASGEVGYPFGPMTRLLLLTGARRDEVAALRRSELSADALTWTLPGARTKNGRDHQIPLSAQAQAVIAGVPAVSAAHDDADVPRHGKLRDLVFSTTGRTPVSGHTKGKARLDAAMLALARKEALERNDDPAEVQIAPWTYHDLRRTAASGMARLGIPLPVVERCLNHVSGSFGGIVGVYQRHGFAEEKRAALTAWGAHVEAIAAR